MAILLSSFHRIRIISSGLFGVRFSISCVYIPSAASFTFRLHLLRSFADFTRRLLCPYVVEFFSVMLYNYYLYDMSAEKK
ncbi:hypothetical protein DXB08_02290 [Hungatella hathewayi]|nr:hypothetical protein DXB08_02290 [Hungatella hathewayi]